jgi:hypothetical protein
MDDAVQRIELRLIGEYHLSERLTVETAVGRKDILTPPLYDVLQCLRVGLHGFTRQDIGVDYRGASIRQHPRYFRFSARDVSGQSDENHLSGIEVSPRLPPSRTRRQDRTLSHTCHA